MESFNIKYSHELEFIGEKTIYVFVNGEKIGWIAARKEYEFGKIYFCLNRKRKPNPKLGQLDSISGQIHIFNTIDEMEEWIINKISK